MVSCSTPELLEVTRYLLGSVTPDLKRATGSEATLPAKCIVFADGPVGPSVTEIDLFVQIGLPASEAGCK